MAPKTFIDPIDFEVLPKELWLHRLNRDAGITEASRIVNEYLPIPDFKNTRSDELSTTVIAAFYPPPSNEAFQRCHKYGVPKKRSLENYIDGLKAMIMACKYLVIFVPPGSLAENLRPLIHGRNVIIIDHYQSVWELPHLRDKQESFYTLQTELHESLGSRGIKTGEPHSWGAWNAKTYFWIEAIRLDPFKTSYFAWLDARTPHDARQAFPDDESLVTGTWPHPEAVKSMRQAMKRPTRAVIILSYTHGLSPPVKDFWPTERPGMKSCKAGIDDIIGVGASVVFGDKASMSRFARAHLILFERDFARDFYVAREELQMSYAFWEFYGLYHALEVFRRRPLKPPMGMGIYAYMLLSKPNSDWSGLALDQEPERLLKTHIKILHNLQPIFQEKWATFKNLKFLKSRSKAPDATAVVQK